MRDICLTVAHYKPIGTPNVYVHNICIVSQKYTLQFLQHLSNFDRSPHNLADMCLIIFCNTVDFLLLCTARISILFACLATVGGQINFV